VASFICKPHGLVLVANCCTLCKRTPVPRMWAMSARADVGGIWLRDSKRRRKKEIVTVECDAESDHLTEVCAFVEPSWNS